MPAGMCTFLNVYSTQPLVPYLQRVYHIGGSLGAIVTGWTWLADGWRSCVFLLMGVAGMALGLAYVSSRATTPEA